MALNNVRSIRRTATQKRSVTASIPAPVGGWNARDAISEMDEKDAVTLTNMFPSTTTANVRFGHSAFATGAPARVDTLMAWQGGASSKLLAASNNAIYNITAGGAFPAALTSGYTNSRWQHVNITTSGGNYLILANGADSVQSFDGTSLATPSITGVTSSTLIGVTVHKNRLWFTPTATLKAWYLPTQSIAGAAVALDLSAFCPHGGYLMSIGTWTMDAGYGVDDHLVLITSEGDCLVYRGTDPASASTWALVGVWWLGNPIGRRCMMKYKGDLLIIGQDGLLPLSGALQSDRLDTRVALTDNIQKAMADAILLYGANFGWQTVPLDNQNMVIMNVPIAVGLEQQYVMNTITKAWCNWTGWRANCWEVYGSNVYFGSDNYVGKAWDTNADRGANINFSALQAFNYFGDRGRTKRFSMFRPNFQVTGTPAINGNLAIDFDQTPPASAISVSAATNSVWDSALWDTGTWGGYSFSRSWQGTAGVGYAAAPNIAGSVNGMELQWISTDVIAEPGGPL